MAIAIAALLAMRALSSAGAGGPEIELLSLIACAVLLAVAALAPAPAAELGGGAVASTVLTLVLPHGAGRGAVVMAVLLVTLALAAARRFDRDGVRLPLHATLALLLGVQFLCRGGLLLDPGLQPRSWFILLGLPVLGAVVVTALARLRGARAWIAAAVLIAAGGGLHGVAVVALAGLVASLLALRPAEGSWSRAAAWCAAGVSVALLVVARPAELWPLAAAGAALALPSPILVPAVAIAGLLGLASVAAAGYPWLRPEPVVAAVRLFSWPQPGHQILAAEITLDAANPGAVIDSPPRPASRVLVRSTLADSLATAPGSPAVNVWLETATGERIELVLRAGYETGEWAARRPDVAPRGLLAPAPWRSVAAAGFFAQEYRASFDLPRSLDVVAVRLERVPTLPPEVRCVVHAIELR